MLGASLSPCSDSLPQEDASLKLLDAAIALLNIRVAIKRRREKREHV